jgi:hypothetical protein
MMKLSPTSGETKAMSVHDIFLSRLKLLIIMAKAYLKSYPIGRYRKSAIIDNANHVFYLSLRFSSEIDFIENHEPESQSGITSKIEIEEERVFHQRVRLLAVIVKAAAENRLTENFGKKALQENLDRICDTLIFDFHIKDLDFLKVA